MKQFKDIKGYEGVYQINIDGLVRRIHTDSRSSPFKILKVAIRSGYYFYTLSGKKHNLHRLLMINYITNINNYPCVNHVDGNRLNNNLSNLEWCTHKQNTQHAFRIGIMRASNIKLTTNDVIEIRKLRKDGMKPGIIAKMYNVEYNAIYRVCANKTHINIKDGI